MSYRELVAILLTLSPEQLDGPSVRILSYVRIEGDTMTLIEG